jgi:hypothetical protein
LEKPGFEPQRKVLGIFPGGIESFGEFWESFQDLKNSSRDLWKVSRDDRGALGANPGF